MKNMYPLENGFWESLEGSVIDGFSPLKTFVKTFVERASRRYEFQRLARDAFAECFERRDVLGSRNECSEVVWS
jgi:hypothetical protein